MPYVLTFRYASGGESSYLQDDGTPFAAWTSRDQATRYDTAIEASDEADRRWSTDSNFRRSIQVVEVAR